MASNLKEVFPEVPWETCLEQAGISSQIRAEALTLEQFKLLANNIK